MNAWDFAPSFPGTTITAVAETGSSWLLFSADHVMKILKPFRKADRDVSTVDARRMALEMEEALLKIFAPGVALHVQPLKHQEQTIEVALVMRRLPRSVNLLARLLTKRALAADLATVGSTLAKIHAKRTAPAVRGETGLPDALRQEIEEAVSPLLDPAASIFLSHDVPVRLREKLLSLVSLRTPTLMERMRHKAIRPVHGSLHAEAVYIEAAGVSFLQSATNPDGSPIIADVFSDLGCLLKDVRVFLPEADVDVLIGAYAGKAKLSTEERDVLTLYEILWTMRRFAQHTLSLTEGTGGPMETELVQRYRLRLIRYSQSPLVPIAVKPVTVSEKYANAHPQPAQKQQKQTQKPSTGRRENGAHPAKASPSSAAMKKSTPKKSVPAKTAPKKSAPKKAAPKKVAPKKTALKKLAPKKVVKAAAKKVPRTKSTSKQHVTKKPASSKAAKKAAPKKTSAKKKSVKASGSIGQTLRSILGIGKKHAARRR